jgi:uncharacterized protein YgfB (UPF0149 family)
MTHPQLQDALASVNMTIDAAEAHGWLSGALCVRRDYGSKDWLAELVADTGGEAPVAAAPLADLPAETLAALGSDSFGFTPLLPDDEAPLADRVAALAAWSGGFLYGIGTGASEKALGGAGDVNEFLRDLADIARAELGPGPAGEAGEKDFMELVEFVRAGAQLAFVELAAARARASG